MENQSVPERRRRSPYQRNRQAQGRYLGWLLVGAMLVLTVLSLLLPDRAYSESENRPLAQRPALTADSAADGSFLKALGSYAADQFPGRDRWISLNLQLNRLLGQREVSGVYLCDDDYLMQAPGQPNEVQLERNLTAIREFSQRHPQLHTVMSVIPNAVTVHADKLPANAPVRDQRGDLQRIREGVLPLNFVDVTDALVSRSQEALFYRTDHHWTSLGAYYAFREIAPALGISAPELSEYTVHTVSDSFEGTLASKSGSHAVRDTVQIFVPPTQVEYFVTYGEDRTGVCSMYHREALNAKDHYTVFFGGNYARVDITTTADTGRNLLVFKDSYANCFLQFLYPYFDHITMVDPRYYYDNVDNAVRSEGITDVLYLYNLDTFLSDASLADVLNEGS